MERYLILLKAFIKDIDSTDKEYIKKNMKEIAKDLYDFSKYLTQIIEISQSKQKLKDKIILLQLLSYKDFRLNAKQSQEIIGILNKHKIGGLSPLANQIVKSGLSSGINKGVNINTIGSLINTGSTDGQTCERCENPFIKMITKVIGTDIEKDPKKFTDYFSNVDYVYLILFLVSSIPFIGFIPNVITIIKALRDKRVYLAILTSLGTFLSLFTLHILDLGLALKVVYFMDVYTTTKYENSGKKQEQIVDVKEADDIALDK
jgi:hypothetical protein